MRLANQLLQLPQELNSSIAWLIRNPDLTLARTWTWLDIIQRTATAASFLLDHGVSPRDRIVNLGCNSLEWAILDLACSTLNAIHVPLDPRMPAALRVKCIVNVEPRFVFSDDPTQDEFSLSSLSVLPISNKSLQDFVQPSDPQDIANILFTSGTTDVPRGVMLSHKNLVSNAIAKLDAMPQSRQDHRLNFLPFSHAYARTCELNAWLMSYSSIEVVHGIDRVLTSAPIVQPTLLNGVPSFYERLAWKWDERGGTQSALLAILGTRIRRLASGGAAIPNAIRARLAKVGLPVFQGYGLTESSPVVCSNRAICKNRNTEPNLVEVGPPVAGVKTRIDHQSKLWVSGDGVMLGYWRDLGATQSKIVDGWLDTGDLAEYVQANNADGEPFAIRILGREDDTIVLSNGCKIEPMPIEQLLREQAWVSNCLLVGKGYPYPILVLSQSSMVEEMSPDAMLTSVSVLLENFPRHAVPRHVLLVDEQWTSDNGLANFKGGLKRKQIEAQLRDRIQQAYLTF